jgi:hypothetical protein
MTKAKLESDKRIPKPEIVPVTPEKAAVTKREPFTEKVMDKMKRDTVKPVDDHLPSKKSKEVAELKEKIVELKEDARREQVMKKMATRTLTPRA